MFGTATGSSSLDMPHMAHSLNQSEDSSTLSSNPTPTQKRRSVRASTSSFRRPTISDEFHFSLPGETRGALSRSSSASSFGSTRSRQSNNSYSNNANVKQLTVNKLRHDDLEKMTDSPSSKAPLGRSREYDLLSERLQAVVEGRVGRELVLMSGYSGVGKTKLASSIRPLVKRGLFVISKFDYDNTTAGDNNNDNDSNPYVAITAAFNRICRDIYRRRCTASSVHGSTDTGTGTGKGEQEIDTKSLSQHLVDAMTPTELYLLEEIVPDMDLLLLENEQTQSSQFATDIKGNTETRPILLHAFRKFLRIIAYHATFLCIVLDDTQWADSASLGLLESILSDQNIKNLMVVACYRSNEVDDNHPWSIMVQGLRNHQQQQQQQQQQKLEEQKLEHSNTNDTDDDSSTGLSITALPLDNLDVDTLNRIIMVLINTDDTARTIELATAIHARTQGNAYFSLTFLENLRDEGLLEFNLGTFRWAWDCQEILDATVATTNMVSLLMDKMNRSGAKGCQMTRLLPLAACLGSSFERKLLELVWMEIEKVGQVGDFNTTEDDDQGDWVVDGEQPDGMDMEMAVGDNERERQFDSLLKMAMEEQFLEPMGETRVRFSHDKIQEASMSLLRGDRFDKLKICVGVVMLAELEPTELDSCLFVAVNLLNSDFLEGFLKGLLMGDASATSRNADDDLTETSCTHTTLRYSIGNTPRFLRRLLRGVSVNPDHEDESSKVSPPPPKTNVSVVGIDTEDLELESFRVRLAQLNLQAAVKAKGLSAFHSAASYAAKGLALLGKEEKWTTTFHLALDLCNVGAEAQANIGAFDKAMMYCTEVLECPQCSIADKIRAYRVLVAHKGGLGDFKEASDLCLEELRRLNYKFPSNRVVKVFKVLKLALQANNSKGLPLSDVAAMPLMADRNIRAVMALMEMTYTFLYLMQDEEGMILVVDKMRRLTMKYGLCKESPGSLMIRCHINMFIFGDVKKGLAYIENVLTALDCLGPYASMAFSRTTWQVYGMVYCWVKPLNTCIAKLEEGFIRGLQVGDTESAAISAWIMVSFEFFTGKMTLDRLKQRCLSFIPQLESLQRFVFSKCISCLLQLAINLSEEGAPNTTLLTGRAMDEADMRKNAAVSSDAYERIALYALDFFVQMAYAFFGDHVNGAAFAIKRGDVILDELRGNALGTLCPVLRAISLYAMARETTGVQRLKYKRLAKQAHSHVRFWVQNGNCNILHLLKLLEAERKSLSRNKEAEATALFREARVLAARGGFRQDAALICERHAEFLLLGCSEGRASADRPGAARQMEEAIRYYSEWGAMHKAKLLRNKYAGLLAAQDWDQLAMALRQGVDVRTRTYRLRKYKDCFVGSEAVDFLSKLTARPREEALEVGRQMSERFDLLEHVCDKDAHPELEDGYLFYRFVTKPKKGGGERRTLIEVPW